MEFRGSTNLHKILLAAFYSSASGGAPLLYVALVLIAAGLGFKVAAVPFHLWAPDTYEGAPAPAAAFIASVSKVASFALLISIGTAALHLFDGVHELRFVAIANGPLPKYLGIFVPVVADSGAARNRLHGAWQPGRPGTNQRAPPARLFGHRACRLHSARSCFLFALERKRQRHSLLHPHLRPHNHRRIRRSLRRRARHR